MSTPAPEPPHPALRRRTLLFGGIAGLTVAAAAGESASSLWNSSLTGDYPLPEHPRTGPVHMQIVAHPDDGLYFINPRIARVLATGAGVCGVVLTAGESDGQNSWNPNRPPDYAGYAAARDTGLRRAYAHLATGDSESAWDRRAADLGSGQQVEVCVLRARPEIHLVFCSLWTNLGRLTGGYTRLLGLWEGDLDTSLALPPAGSPLTGESLVDYDTIRATLRELLEHYRPAVVNTLDPDPDPVVGERLGAEQDGYSDHIDHTAAALFAWDAVRDWGGAAVVESWRGYYNRRWPGNLGIADRQTKGRALNVYAWADGFDCGEPSGCGDRLVNGPGPGDTYGIATHPRYAAAVATAAVGGAVRPITVRGSRLHVQSGQAWQDLGGPELIPEIGVTASHVFGVSPEYARAREDHTRDVQCLDLAGGEWTNLGNPAGSGDRARHIGSATGADDGTATVVAVRSPDRGVEVRTRPTGGEWSDWTPLDGPMVHDSPAAVVTAEGIAILAATPDGIAIWERDGEDWTGRDLDLPHVGGEDGYVPASAVTVAAAPDGRLVIASRSAGSADVVLHYGLGKTWTATLLPLDGGILAPAVAVAADGTVAVAVDDATGAPAVAALALADLEHGPAGRVDAPWSRGDIVLTRRPAIAFDEAGGLRLWATAADGEVYTTASAPGVPPGTTWAPALREGDSAELWCGSGPTRTEPQVTDAITIPAELLPADGRFGSGPSKVPTEAMSALAAVGKSVMGTSHRKSAVKDQVGRLRRGLSDLFALPEGYEVVLGVGGTTAFWEVAVFGLVDDKAQAASFGEFGSKFAKAIKIAPHLSDPTVVTAEPGSAAYLSAEDGVDVYATPHNETSTGVAVDVERVAADGALMLHDATSAAAGLPVDMTQTDCYYFAPQKGLASDGGLWIALMSPAAIERAERIAASGRYIPAFLDLKTAIDNSRKDQTYNTPAVATVVLAAEQVDALNAAGGLEAAAKRCAESAGTLYSWADSREFATPFVTEERLRSNVVATIDFDGVDAAAIAKVLRANGVLDTEPYRKLGRNQLRVATYPAVDPSDAAKLTGAIDYVVEHLA